MPSRRCFDIAARSDSLDLLQDLLWFESMLKNVRKDDETESVALEGKVLCARPNEGTFQVQVSGALGVVPQHVARHVRARIGKRTATDVQDEFARADAHPKFPRREPKLC